MAMTMVLTLLVCTWLPREDMGGAEAEEGGDKVGGRYGQPPGFIGFEYREANERVDKNNTYSRPYTS